MLEPCVNQAAGLAGLAGPSVPRLIAAASHGKQQGELPLLWGLCTSWVEMGLSVIVLDGHSQESDGNPGLWHVLNAAQPGLSADPQPQPWSVMPAGLGIEWLSNTGANVQALGHLLQQHKIVVIYAPASALTVLLRGTGISPLLVVPPLKSATLTAYQALKHMLTDAGLEPTVASITLAPIGRSAQLSPVQTLRDCAKSFLGIQLRPIDLNALASEPQSEQEITHLALQLLENAMTLERHTKDWTH